MVSKITIFFIKNTLHKIGAVL